jgi:hypothetical protein
MTFHTWRIIHRASTAILALFAILHCSLTFFLYDGWSPEALWFLGTGMGLFLLAISNWSHVGLEPCRQPTAPVVKWANALFTLFAIAAVIAVPEPHAYLILASIVVQAVASTRTLSPSA